MEKRKIQAKTAGAHARRFPTTKTKRANFERRLHRDEYALSELLVIEFVRERNGATLREMADVLFGGDYLKAKNAVRRPRGDGGLPQRIRRTAAGTYKPARLIKELAAIEQEEAEQLELVPTEPAQASA